MRQSLTEQAGLFAPGVGEVAERVGVTVPGNVEIPGCHERVGRIMTMLPLSFQSGVGVGVKERSQFRLLRRV